MEKLKIGDNYAGGIIFHLSDANHGTVCSANDLGYYDWWNAIIACDELDEGGYTDWYLPTKDELQEMYTNLHEKNLGNFSKEFYWSSTEDSNGNPWVQSFRIDYQSFNYKQTGRHVRAVRIF